MFKSIIDFYRVSQAKPCNGGALSSNSLSSDFRPEDRRRLKRLQWSTFLAATLGYGMYYVCRLSLNVVKKPIVDEGVFSETELGIIGAVLFFTYAVGKFTNGFLADRSNINRFMSTGLLVTALPYFGVSAVGFSLWELLPVWSVCPAGLPTRSVALSMASGVPAIISVRQ